MILAVIGVTSIPGIKHAHTNDANSDKKIRIPEEK